MQLISLLEILGKPIDSPEMQKFLEDINEKPDVDDSGEWRGFSFPDSGIDILYLGSDSLVNSIYLFADKHEGHSEYKGELPGGATFKDKRQDVRLKQSSRVRGGWRTGPSDPPEVEWDLYAQKPYFFHFEFVKGGRLLMVTLMLKDYGLEEEQVAL